MTMRRRTASGLVLLVGAAALASVGPAQAATWLPGVSVSDETRGDVDGLENLRLVVDADGTATAIWAMDQPGTPVVQIAARAAGATDFGPVHDLGDGEEPDLVAHPDGSVTAAWKAGQSLWTATRPAGAPAFASAAPIPGVASGGIDEPRLTVDGLGNVTMAFLVDDALWSTTRDAVSGVWSTPSPVPSAGRVGGFDVEAAPDGTVTFAWQAINLLGEVQGVRASSRSLEGSLGETELVDSSRSTLATLALADNAAGVTALSWIGRGGVQVSVRAETDDVFAAGVGPPATNGCSKTLPSSLTTPVV